MNHSVKEEGLAETSSPRQWTIDRRQLLSLFILGAAVFLLVPKLIGIHRVVYLLQIAHPTYLMFALAAEALRYFVSATSTIVLARVFGVVVPSMPMVEAFFAGAAANRTFSTGGAPGMIVRFAFLRQEGLRAGAVAVIFLIEDIIGLVIGGAVLLAGIVTLTNALPPGTLVIDASLVFAVGSPLLILAGWYIYRHRTWVEQSAHALAGVLNRPSEWLFGHGALTPNTVQRALDDFYVGMSAARRAPLNVAAALAANVIRYVAGIAALYFAFLAMQWTISPAVLILVYTAASVLSTVSAVPGEVAIMGTSVALLSLAFGVPGDVAMLALLLSRAIAFWLPLPVGLAAFWHLRRNHLI